MRPLWQPRRALLKRLVHCRLMIVHDAGGVPTPVAPTEAGAHHSLSVPKIKDYFIEEIVNVCFLFGMML